MITRRTVRVTGLVSFYGGALAGIAVARLDSPWSYVVVVVAVLARHVLVNTAAARW